MHLFSRHEIISIRTHIQGSIPWGLVSLLGISDRYLKQQLNQDSQEVPNVAGVALEM